MSVLTKNNAPLTQSDGKVLKLAPIIDISTDFGVIKDASNLVSSVKSNNAQNIFRAPLGKEPIEEGDGFDFSINDKKIIGPSFRYFEPFTMEFWIKPTALNSARIPINQRQGLQSVLFRIATEVNGKFLTGLGGITNFSPQGHNNIIPPINEWTHVLVGFNGTAYTVFTNGYAGYVRVVTAINSVSPNPLSIGGDADLTLSDYIGKMNYIKILPNCSEKFNSWDGVGIKPGYENTTINKIFQSPIYPNTIL